MAGNRTLDHRIWGIAWPAILSNISIPLLGLVDAANIGLDFLFIVGLGLNSDGAAIATVIAEYLGCGLALLVVWRKLPARPAGEFFVRLKNLPAYRRLLRSSRHLFLRTVSLLFSFAFFTAMGEKLGSDTLAANSLMMHLLMLAAYGMDGFAFAAEGITGTRLGAGDLDGFFAAVRRCGLWCALAAGLTSALFWLSSPLLPGLLTDLGDVQRQMSEHYFWLVMLPLVAAPSYLLDGVFIGSAQTRYMMTTMLVSVIAVYLPVWFFTRPWGNHGLWLALTLFNATRGLTLFYCYQDLSRRGRWLQSD